MTVIEDLDLLRRYVAEDSDEAFSALASRYLNLVYSAALRQVRDPQLAQEVVQTVFVLLFKKAKSLPKTVILSGWLYRATGYVASDALRSESRRRNRETIAMQPLYETKSPALWEAIEPILDPAMAELGEKDRSLILLRFFEEKSLKELGAILGVSEDAAQKKVARALEKLREILAHRGATASSASLAGALAAFACGTAPPTMAASIATITSASTAAVGLTFLTNTALNFMNMTKVSLTCAALIILGAVSTPIVTQHRALARERGENATLRADIQLLEARPALNKPNAIDPELEQLRSLAAEVPRLRGQVAMLLREKAQIAQPEGLGEDTGPKDPMARQTAADNQVKEGKFAEALKNYLWCYDEGTKHSPSYSGVRDSFLLMQMASLAAKYPPAREALIARREAVETSLLANTSGNPMASFSLVQLNQYLGEPDRTLSLFDQLPAKSPARGQLVSYAMEQFNNASRYQDIVDSARPETSFDQAIAMAKLVPVTEDDKNSQTRADIMRRSAVDAGGRALEALAAVGQTERANALADKILKFDKTPETRGELLRHAARAGNAAVTTYIQSP